MYKDTEAVEADKNICENNCYVIVNGWHMKQHINRNGPAVGMAK